MEEIWATIESHIKETITLTPWTHEDYSTEAREKQILQGWGIWTLPVNNARPKKMIM